jgi:rod shape-determining protein MreC
VALNLLQNDSKKLRVGINIAVLALAFFGVTRRSYNVEQLTRFDALMIDTFAPIQRSITFANEQVSGFFKHYTLNVSASQKNQELLRTIFELEERLFNIKEMEMENRRLKELLEFANEIPGKKVLAQIVSWDASSDFRTLRVNKGLKDGLQLQATVVTAEGLVGYVYRLTNHFADVLTILDPNNRTDVIIQRTRSQGIMEGYSANRGLMKYVGRTEPIILGDEVLTSGLGHIYPKGIRVGRVSRIERESYGITQHVEVRPSVDFSRLEEVMVLVSDEDQLRRLEWKALEQTESTLNR